MKPVISVVVPTRDRPRELRAMLESVLAGDFPSSAFEVVVADNGTGPETANVVDDLSRRGPIRRVAVPEPGLHAARHTGMAAAVADLLVFADDDIVAGRTWLSAIHNGFAPDDVAMVGGNCIGRFAAPMTPWLTRLWRHKVAGLHCIPELSLVEFGAAERDIDPQFVFGCNFAVRRKVVIDAGGFHPDGFPESLLRLRGDGETYIAEFVRASGARARFVPGASVEHVVPEARMAPAYFDRRNFAQGVSDSYTQIRALGHVPAELPESLRVTPRSLARILYPPHLARWHWRRLRARRQGARFHRDQVRSDSALLAWVRRDNYLGDGAR